MKQMTPLPKQKIYYRNSIIPSNMDYFNNFYKIVEENSLIGFCHQSGSSPVSFRGTSSF